MSIGTLDAISIAVGSAHFVQNHKLAGLQLKFAAGHSPRLRVSRYYWDLERPVAVDIAKEIRFGEHEIAAKRAYFEDRGARYIVVADAFDGEAAEAALAALEPELPIEQAIKEAARPLTAPRSGSGKTRTGRR